MFSRIFFYGNYAFITFLLLACSAGQEENNKAALFTSLYAEDTGISFINEVKDREDFNIFNYRNYYNGGGVAIGDINNDNLPDVYMTSNMDKNRLYLNKGNWQFEDITEKAGVGGTKSWSTGVTMADVNGDGLLDIYVCNSGDVKGDNKENELFINAGNLTFKESAEEFGLNDRGFSTHASFFDYDMDGDLDCFLLNNSFKSIDRVDQFLVKRDVRDPDGGDKLFRNDNNHFNDVSEHANIYGSAIDFGLGVSVSDLNEDMLPDIYVSNDFWERDYLYINQGKGVFSEEIISRTSVISASSMGSDVADLNNDGSPEIFTTDMLPGDNNRLKTMTRFEETNIKELRVRSSYHYQLMQNCLQYNDGTGNFKEMAFLYNTAATDWSWGSLMFDMNNDGWKDIFVSNGIYRDITSMDFADFASDKENIKKMIQEKGGKFDFNDLLAQFPSSKISSYAFINRQGRTFENIADSLGLGEPSFSNGAAYGDLDNDGDLDLVINRVNMPCGVYRNNADKLLGNNYLKVKFKGSPGNNFGIGAKVVIHSKGNKQVMQNFQARGFESSVEPNLLFGLGKTTVLDSLVVIWPDMKMQTIANVKSNQVISADYLQADKFFVPGKERTGPLYKEVTKTLLHGNYTHRENDFNDFDHERLLPRKVSTEGPKVLKGDLNGDKLEDFMLLGAYGDADKIFLQQKSGQFREQQQRTLIADSVFESTCGVFFDPDSDGDLDILIGSGGNEFRRGARAHLLRYYQNDGKGNFSKVTNKLPSVVGNFSCILAEDFDRDGDQDLFIGGRIVPGNYGLIPRSFLFRNEGEGWTEVTPETLGGAGMVTGAVWNDVDDDKDKDLIVVGEWMPVKVYKNNGTALEEVNDLKGTEGWWNTIGMADLNEDGRQDFVLGNWGLNTKFRASANRPLTMFVKDFDQNNKSEFIINWFPPLENKAYPFASKMDMTGQLPFLKKNSIKYSDYARKTYETILTEEQRKGAIEYKAIYLESAILWNTGNSNFRMEALPVEAQVSPVFSVLIDDLDGDNHTDILLGGNFYGLKPEVGRQDSNTGVVLKGDGQGRFINVPTAQTGIYIRGEVRDMKILSVPGKNKTFIIGRNNDSALIFSKAGVAK